MARSEGTVRPRQPGTRVAGVALAAPVVASDPISPGSDQVGGTSMPRVLIVEDDPDQAELLARMLLHRGFEVEIAGAGGQGVALACSNPPDLLLLDLMLPDISGFEVCRQLRAAPVTWLVPIVMITALGDDRHRFHGVRVGANAYVAKPYGPEELFEAIDRATSWRERLDRRAIQGEIQVELNSELAFLQEVNDFLLSLSLARPLSGEQAFGLRQALMEMGQNAIEWGNRHRPEALVTITYRIHPDRVELVVRDQGAGFDPADLPHAASDHDPIGHMDVREKLGMREGGFGLMISRGLVDELRHNAVGNEVTLIKRFAAAEVPGR